MDVFLRFFSILAGIHSGYVLFLLFIDMKTNFGSFSRERRSGISSTLDQIDFLREKELNPATNEKDRSESLDVVVVVEVEKATKPISYKVLL